MRSAGAGASSLKQPIVLRIYKDARLEAVRQFEHSQIVIGRTSDVQLELQDEGVGLLHAMIEDRGGEYYISDLGSPGGTFKNGNRILEDKLASGDEVRIGPFRIQFFVGIPKPAAPPKAVATPVTPMAPPASVTFSAGAAEIGQEDDTLPQIDLEPPPAPAKAPENKKPERQVAATPAAPSKPAAPQQDKPRERKYAVAAPSAFAKKKHKKTFAPPSPYSDLKEIVKPGKGSQVEVIVAWKDRILSTNHFSRSGSVYISSNDTADVFVPIISSRSKYELLKIGSQITVCLTPEMTGEVVRDGESLSFAELARQNKLRNVGTHFELDVRQGEMVRVGLQNDMISIYIRYAAETPKPLVAPLLDMTSSETTGVILAMAIALILGLYMNIYTPPPLQDEEAKIEEPLRKAIVQFKPPAKKEVVKVDDTPKQEKKVVQVKEKPKTQVRQTPNPTVEKKSDPGKASEVAAKPNSKHKPKELTSTHPKGGAVKTASKEGAQMKSNKPDPNKMGLLSAFGSGGMRKNLDKAYSGSGELAGMADAATGTAGNAENRAGDDLGSHLKDTGAGGKGTSTVGIAGIGTQGRGTGTTGYGTGGIGQKGSVQINVGGQEADFTGGMDKEAIRRVIREHIREIRNCYERQLQRTPDLYGKIVLEWDIEEGGRVSRCIPKSNEMGNAQVADCISRRLKTWKFPDPPKDQIGRVSYPFVFSSQ